MSALTIKGGKLPNFAPRVVRLLSGEDPADPHMRIVTDPAYVPEVYDNPYTRAVILRGAFDLAGAARRIGAGGLPPGRGNLCWSFHARATPLGLVETSAAPPAVVGFPLYDAMRSSANIIWQTEGSPRNDLVVTFDMRTQNWPAGRAIPEEEMRHRSCVPHRDEKLRGRAVVSATEDPRMMTQWLPGPFTDAALKKLCTAFKTAQDPAEVMAEYGCRQLEVGDILFIKGTHAGLARENAIVHKTPEPQPGALRLAGVSEVYRNDMRRWNRRPA